MRTTRTTRQSAKENRPRAASQTVPFCHFPSSSTHTITVSRRHEFVAPDEPEPLEAAPPPPPLLRGHAQVETGVSKSPQKRSRSNSSTSASRSTSASPPRPPARPRLEVVTAPDHNGLFLLPALPQLPVAWLGDTGHDGGLPPPRPPHRRQLSNGTMFAVNALMSTQAGGPVRVRARARAPPPARSPPASLQSPPSSLVGGAFLFEPLISPPEQYLANSFALFDDAASNGGGSAVPSPTPKAAAAAAAAAAEVPAPLVRAPSLMRRKRSVEAVEGLLNLPAGGGAGASGGGDLPPHDADVPPKSAYSSADESLDEIMRGPMDAGTREASGSWDWDSELGRVDSLPPLRMGESLPRRDSAREAVGDRRDAAVAPGAGRG